MGFFNKNEVVCHVNPKVWDLRICPRELMVEEFHVISLTGSRIPEAYRRWQGRLREGSAVAGEEAQGLTSRGRYGVPTFGGGVWDSALRFSGGSQKFMYNYN